MSLQASIKTAGQVFKQHDFSRQHQLRLLDFNNVPDYVRKEFIDLEGRLYITSMVVPAKSISKLEIPFMSFTFRAPNMVQYPGDWQITLSTPADYLTRNAVERWMNDVINEQTLCGSGFPCQDTYIDLAVLGPNCQVVRGYRLIGVWPSDIGEVAYNQESTNRTTFSVTFTYQRWEPIDINDTIIEEGNQNQIDSVYEGFESKIAAGVGTSCVGKTTIPRV
jgi:hypothetical protein